MGEMTLVNREEISRNIEDLIRKYKSQSIDELREINEANVRKDFIDPLFESLGWNVRDHHEYDSERYIRDEGEEEKFGYVDVALKIDQENPVIFVEAKRFGKVAPKEKRDLKQDKDGNIIKIDWFSEERQVLNYAAQQHIKWAVLTNFEIFRVFNALNGLLVLEIESPDDYLNRLDEILLLHKDYVISGQIDRLETRIERPDVDLNFLNIIKEWRQRIANSVFNLNRELFSNSTLGELKEVTQRIIDRLIIIRYAEDCFILDPDQLLSLNDSWKKTKKFMSLKERIVSFFNGFAGIYNSKIFEREHLSETVSIDDEILGEIIDETYSICFRKFTSDILGNTYESYLGHDLKFVDGTIEVVPNETIQKAGGIYYTPEYIVDFIIHNSLLNILEEIIQRVEEHFEKGDFEEAVQIFQEEIEKIKILDPACGSGTFLINSFNLIKQYYDRMNAIIEKMNEKLPKKYGKEWFVHTINKFTNYEYRILQNNLFGVDLDPQAVEITSVNLILQALKKDRPLPLILDENIKVGNSLISFDHDWELPNEHTQDLRRLLDQRKKIKQTENQEEKRNLMGEIQRIRENLYEAVTPNIIELIGEDYREDPKLIPFIWEIEFPEVLLNESERELKGFDIIAGNPPYIGWSKIQSDRRLFEDGEYLDIEYKCRPKHPDEQPNIYLFFLVRCLNLVHEKGIVSLIIPQEWKFHKKAQDFRDYFLDKSKAINVLNFHPDFRVFPGIGTTSLIIFLDSNQDEEHVILSKINFQENEKVHSLLTKYDLGSAIPEDYSDEEFDIFYEPDKGNLKGERWEIRSKLFRTLKEKFTGDTYISLDNRQSFSVFGGFQSPTKGEISDKHFTLSQEEYDRLPENERGYVMPMIYEARSIKRFHLDPADRYWIVLNEVFSNETEFRGSMPTLFTLLNRRIKNKSNDKWWEFPNVRRLDLYRESEEKLLSPRTANRNSFAIDSGKHVIKGTNTAIVAKEHDIRHILLILNSLLADYWYDQYGFGYHGGKTKKYEPGKVKKYSLPVFRSTDDNLIKLANERMRLSGEYQSLIERNTFLTFLQDNGFQASELKPLGDISRIYTDSRAAILQYDYFENFIIDGNKLKVNVRENDVILPFDNNTVLQWVKLVLESISNEEIDSLNEDSTLNTITKKLRKIRIPWVNETSIFASLIQNWQHQQVEAENRNNHIEFLDRIIDRYVYDLYGLSEEQINEIETYFSYLENSPLPSSQRVNEFLNNLTQN